MQKGWGLQHRSRLEALQTGPLPTKCAIFPRTFLVSLGDKRKRLADVDSSDHILGGFFLGRDFAGLETSHDAPLPPNIKEAQIGGQRRQSTAWCDRIGRKQTDYQTKMASQQVHTLLFVVLCGTAERLFLQQSLAWIDGRWNRTKTPSRTEQFRSGGMSRFDSPPI